METQVVDLGSFVTKTFSLKFTINEHPYSFEYTEATVDEVFRLMVEPNEADPITKVRNAVTEFLCRRVSEDKRDILRKDLQTLPYKGQGLDISTIYDALQLRYQKKDRGDAPPPAKEPSGWFGR